MTDKKELLLNALVATHEQVIDNLRNQNAGYLKTTFQAITCMAKLRHQTKQTAKEFGVVVEGSLTLQTARAIATAATKEGFSGGARLNLLCDWQQSMWQNAKEATQTENLSEFRIVKREAGKLPKP